MRNELSQCEQEKGAAKVRFTRKDPVIMINFHRQEY